jgi:hypothetical protein
LLITKNVSGNPENQDYTAVRPNDAGMLYCCSEMREAGDRDTSLCPSLQRGISDDLLLPLPKGDRGDFCY